MLCDYGCGKKAIFQLKNEKHCCSKSVNKCPAMKEKNSLGLKKAYREGRKKKYAFSDKDRKKSNEKSIQKAKEKAFSKNSSYPNEALKKYLLEEGREYKCSECGISSWNGKELVLELDHINGNNCDNRKENLRFLCPNCHSQTSTFRGRNKNNGAKKVSDEALKKALDSSKSIRQALLKVGLAPKGANYTRAYKLKALSAGVGNSSVKSDEFRETLTDNADGNPEPSLGRSSKEGAETNG